jgi:hypothetical protein
LSIVQYYRVLLVAMTDLASQGATFCLSIIVDAFVGALTRRVTRAFHPRRAQAHTPDFESTTSRLMSFPLDEDVDASQVRTFLEGSLCMLTLRQPVIYIPCDETGMGAKHARPIFVYYQHLISQDPTSEMTRINSYPKDILPLTKETCQEAMSHASTCTELRGRSVSVGLKCVSSSLPFLSALVLKQST